MINFYELLKIIEQNSASSEVMLSDIPVEIEVPKFPRGTFEYYKISARQMANEMEYSVLNKDGKYQLYDKYKDFIVYKNKELKEIVSFLVDSYIRYKMGIITRRRSAYKREY